MPATIVAYYGQKPAPLQHLILAVQTQLAQMLGRAFHPYAIEEVHATLIGLEGCRIGATLYNSNFQSLRHEQRVMNLAGVLELFCQSQRLPIGLQIGGFQADITYPFTSQNQHPYHRSFAIQGSTAVLMGWPRQSDRYPLTLDQLRQDCQAYNVLHKYHAHPEDVDNDCFMVLGQVLRDRLSEAQVHQAQTLIRAYLATHRLQLALTLAHLSLVLYDDDPRLPWPDCQQIPLVQAQTALSFMVQQKEATL